MIFCIMREWLEQSYFRLPFSGVPPASVNAFMSEIGHTAELTKHRSHITTYRRLFSSDRDPALSYNVCQRDG